MVADGKYTNRHVEIRSSSPATISKALQIYQLDRIEIKYVFLSSGLHMAGIDPGKEKPKRINQLILKNT